MGDAREWLSWLPSVALLGERQQSDAEPMWSPWDLSSTNPHVPNEDDLHQHHDDDSESVSSRSSVVSSRSSFVAASTAKTMTTHTRTSRAASRLPDGAIGVAGFPPMTQEDFILQGLKTILGKDVEPETTTAQLSEKDRFVFYRNRDAALVERKNRKWLRDMGPSRVLKHKGRQQQLSAQERTHGRQTFPSNHMQASDTEARSGANAHAATCRCPTCRSLCDSELTTKMHAEVQNHLTSQRVAEAGSSFKRHFEAFCELQAMQDRVIYVQRDHPMHEEFRP